MPPRQSPTMRQRRLGVELRRIREHAGLTAEALAVHLGTDRYKVSQMESGKSGISSDRIRSWAAACKCPSPELIDALAGMAGERGKGWWESHRGAVSSNFLNIAEMEHHARELRLASTTHLPGLLQTGPYAAAVFGTEVPSLPRHEIDARTAFRVQRQRTVKSDGGKHLTAYVHEAALRMEFGGEAVLREQLQCLLGDSERPTITLRAVPFKLGTPPGAGEGITYALGAIAELDTVQVEVSRGPLFLDAENELASYREIFKSLERVALSPEESRDFIRSLIHDL
jgi:transcriptional regulator with XRE-family HTH domain